MVYPIIWYKWIRTTFRKQEFSYVLTTLNDKCHQIGSMILIINLRSLIGNFSRNKIPNRTVLICTVRNLHLIHLIWFSISFLRNSLLLLLLFCFEIEDNQKGDASDSNNGNHNHNCYDETIHQGTISVSIVWRNISSLVIFVQIWTEGKSNKNKLNEYLYKDPGSIPADPKRNVCYLKNLPFLIDCQTLFCLCKINWNSFNTVYIAILFLNGFQTFGEYFCHFELFSLSPSTIIM